MPNALRHRVAPIALSLIALTLSPLYGCGNASASDQNASSSDLALIRSVMARVQASYVHPVGSDDLVNNALKGMLSGLDPHSAYMDESEYRELIADTRGKFGGLGIELDFRNGTPRIISPIDGTPAARAGLKPGDVITKIGNLSTEGLNSQQIVNRLRGEPGSSVTLTIARTSMPAFPVTITRAIIQVASVKYKLEPNRIGYARISIFDETTQRELSSAIAALQQQAGGSLNGFVLDLRNDPGGLLDAAVNVAGDFLDGGMVVSTRGRSGGDDHVYTAPADGNRLGRTPMVVLINSASASASEIVAGALQDRHRATVIGTTSFGKGSVQTIIPLDGHGALRLTTALYYTPAGRSIQDLGITPNLVIGLPKDAQVPNATVTREADLHGALKNSGALKPENTGPLTTGVPQPTTPQTATAGKTASARNDSAPIDPSLIATAKDAQLATALRYIAQGCAGAAGGTVMSKQCTAEAFLRSNRT